MCDCFHLAFPNWHVPAAGAGRRLRGPEQEAEDDSVCEEAEILERERPRPQGSSPVEEFPVEKQAEEDMSVYKGGSNKKSRKAGFGSLFDKHSSDKMNETEDMQSDESEIIVKTVKEPCIEGLVVTGGGKEGIFVKEVKLDSPASKHLSVKEGDQILSATVYFDNVSYEDALQILERAQPYKMEFCLRRKVETPIPENAEIKHPKDKDQAPPEMRSQTKMKKQQERISWPKFPSFGKGSRMQFRRSHSTSEAEEHRKLEMSPPTSDTESPLKSPLKSSDGKDKKKKHKVQLKFKMKGHRSKSVEEPQRDEQVMAWENQQVEDILEERVPEELEEKKQDIPEVLDGSEYEISSKTGKDDPFQNLELYETHLISLGSTLKTTDISLALSEGRKMESSEMQVRIQMKEQPDTDTENQGENIDALYTTSDPSPCENAVLSQAEIEIAQLDNDPNVQGTDHSEEQIQSGIAELSMPKLDVCEGETKRSPGIGTDKQWKERSVFESESYGIRTRGPLADIATSKTHFVNTINGLQFISPDYPAVGKVGEISDGISDDKKPTVISLPKLGSTIFDGDTDEARFDTLPPETADFTCQDKKSTFKLPKVDHAGFVSQNELIKMTEVDKNRTLLPKREDIEIPGMEHKETKLNLQTPDIKGPKIEKIINITKEREIQSPQTEFNVEDVKVAVSKFPAFKLPEGDITGVLVQREITLMEQKSDKSLLTPRGSPHKVSITSTDSNLFITKSRIDEERSPSDTVATDASIQMSKVELPYIDNQTSPAVMEIDYTKPQMTDYGRLGDINFKLPKREDIEIPGMEAIKESIIQNAVIEAGRDADRNQVEKAKVKKHGDKKGHEKKSKKPKISSEGIDITKPDIQFPNISMEGPMEGSVQMDTGETNIHAKHKFKSPKVEEVDHISASSNILEDNMDNKNWPQKIETKFGKTKFKIPSITIPEFGTKFPRGEDISAVDVQRKAAEKTLPEEKLSAEPVLFDTDGPDAQTVCVSGRVRDSEPEEHGKKFKLPKFEISLPEVKAPKLICTSKIEDDNSLSEASAEVPVVHSHETGPPDKESGVRTDQPEVGSEITEVKFKKPGFSFPRFGISKSEYSAQAADVANPDIVLPEGHREMADPNPNVAISVKDGKQKDAAKFVSPTKFKIPSIKFPNFGTKITKTAVESPDVNVDVKGREISVPEAEPALVNIKGPDSAKESKSLSREKKEQEIHVRDQGSKFKLPKFGISIPEIKGPKMDIISVQEEGKTNIQVNLTDFDAGTTELKADLPVDLDNVYIQKTARENSEVDIDVKGPDRSLPDVELKWPAETLLVDVKGPDADEEIKLPNVEIENLQVKEQGSKFKLPTFGISVPEVKGPKIEASLGKAETEISIPKGKADVHPADVEVQGVTAEIKADLPDVDSKDIEMKMKTPGFSLPRIGFIKSEVKSPEVDVSLPDVDVSLPEGSIKMGRPTADAAFSMEDAEETDPTKFKLPSFTLPKFGTKYPKFTVEGSNADIDIKGAEISLPEGEMKLSTVEIKGPDVDKEMKSLSMEIQDQDVQIKDQGSKFKLPKFGISLPEVKGPKIDVSSGKAEIDISVPKASIDVHPPEVEVESVTAEIKADLPDVDSKDIEMKMKTPGFSLPRIGFSKSDVKSPEVDVSLPDVDVSLPEGSVEIEKPTTDVTMPMEDAELKGRSKFGSPTKFKLPSFTFPKFGTKASKATVEVPDVDVDIKGPEISLPEAKVKLSTEPVTLEIKGPDVDKEMKSLSMEIQDQDVQIKDQGSKFKLPKFGISLPEVKMPKIDVSSGKADTDISVPKASIDVHPPEVEVQGVTAEIKADLPDVDSKDIEMKMKTPGFSLPRIGFSKSDVTSPEVDVSLPDVDVSLPESRMEIEKPTTDVTISVEDAELKGQSKFGSPTKFKLPSFTLPKFGTKASKATVEVPDVDVDIKGPEISLPEAKMKLSTEPVTLEIKEPDVDKEMKSLSMEIQDQDVQIKDQGSKFKLPKFGISLPEVKGPKFNVSSGKAETEISIPRGKADVHPPEVEVQGVTAEIKADLPDVDSKDIEMKMKTPGFSLPRIGFIKSDVKSPEVDVSLPDVDVSLPEGTVEIEKPTTDVTMPMEDAELKGRSKFGSPTKFKLPSFTFPKFGTKASKATVEVPDVDVDVKGPEISLPEAKVKLSAEPVTVDIKGPEEMKSLSMEIQDQDVQIKDQGSKFKLPKFGISLPEVKGPKIDVSSGKAELDISVPKASIDVHPPEVEVQGVTAEIKADLPDVDSKDIEMKMKTPGFSLPRIGFSKSDVTSPEVDVNLPDVDVSLPESRMEIEKPTTDVTISVEDAELKGQSKFGSPTKFKLPSFTFPKFGTKGPKATMELSDVDVDLKGPEITLPDAEMNLSAEPVTVDIKGPEISLPDAEMKLSTEPVTLEIKGPEVDKEMKSLSMEIQDQDVQIKDQGNKFKLPKFGISLPEVKMPKIDVGSGKAETEISIPKGKPKASIDVHPPEVEVQGVKAEIKADLPDVDSKDVEMKMKTPGFSLPRIGFIKSEVKSPEVDVSLPDVDVSLPKGSVEIEKPTTDVTMPMEDAELKGRSKFGSPTKFKLPSFTFPKFGTKGPKATVEVPDVDVDVKGPEISLPEAKVKLSTEPVTLEIKGPEVDKEMKTPSMEIQDQDVQIKDQGMKFKLPKFGISLPEVKGPKIDVSSGKAELDISVLKASIDVHPPEVEVQGVTAEIKADLPDVDSKDIEMKMKTPGFSLPRIGFSKSDVTSPEVDVNLPDVDVSLPESRMEIEKPTTDVTISVEDAELKGQSKFGSPTKFKLPSFTLPKFGTKASKATVEVPDVNVDVKGPEITLPEAEMKLSTVDIKGPDVDKEMKSLSMEIQDQDVQIKDQGSKFKLPKFGISLPEVKVPKIDVGSGKAETEISIPKGKPKASIDVHPPEVEVQGVTAEIKADLPDVDSKDVEMKMKTPGFSLPRIGFSKSDVKSPEVDVSLPDVDVSLPEGSVEIEKPTTDVTMPMEDAEHKGRLKFGSPTKFKLPSFTFPKFGTKASKATVEVPDVDVDVKGPEISLPEAKVKLSAKPVTVDIKGPEEMKSLSMEIQDQDVQIKDQGSKFKLPKFGISLPEVKVPKIDVGSGKAETEISIPKGKPKASIDVHPPEVEVQGVTAEIKADLPDVDSKDIEMKMKTPGFSLPRIGFSKSDVTSPEVDVSLPDVDVSLPEGSVDIEKPTTDVTMPMEDAEKHDWSKSGSPIKFKLPSIDFPKFGTKGSKVALEVSAMDVKEPEISLPDAEMNIPVKPVPVDIKRPDADKEIKLTSMEIQDQDIQLKEQGNQFKLPTFGIGVPELKGPKIDVSSDKKEMDILVAKADVHPPEVDVHGVTGEIKAELPDIDSKDIKVEMKTPGFSFPRIGFSKSGVKLPEVDVSSPNVDVSLPEASMDIERPTTDVRTSVEEPKGRSIFGSPTKFKLPSFTLPKFGSKGPKATVEGSDIDVDLKGPEISLPEVEMKLSTEPVTVDTQYGSSLPEVKGPTFDLSLDKAEMDISVHPSDVEVQDLTAKVKTDLPEVYSKDTKAKMKTPGFSSPRTGLSKPDVDVSLPNVDVSLPERSVEIERPTADVTMPVEDAEHKGRSKFGSPTKFKLPSINFPKFGTKVPKATVEVSDVDVAVKGPEITLPEAGKKVSAEQVTMDIKDPRAGKELKSLGMEIKDKDVQIKEQESKFKLPKFEISVPDIKAPKIDVRTDKAEIDISMQKAKAEVQPPDLKVQGVTGEIKGDLPEVDSKNSDIKIKTPGFSFPRIGFSKSEAKATVLDPGLQNVDTPLPEGSMEMKGASTDVTISVEDAEHKGRSKFGSPTKFKLPSINFPKFGTKGPKATVEVSDVDVDVKGAEISLPDTQVKLPSESLSGPDTDEGIQSLSMEMKDQDFQVKEQDMTFKLPKFGISLPEVKGPKIDVSSGKAEIDISVPKAKADVQPPDVEVKGVTTEVKADLPEVDTEMKMKRPGLDFPRSSQTDSKSPASNEVAMAELDSQVGKGEDDPFVNDNAADVSKQNYTKGMTTSSKFILPSLGDVFSGFEVEFNVPTFEENEEVKNISEFLKQEHSIAFRGQVSTDSETKHKDGLAKENAKTDQNKDGVQNQSQPEDTDWFRFPMFSSPSKTTKDNKDAASVFPRKFHQSPQSDINENEYKKSLARETDEETVSPTLSLSSSDAFADVSSAVTTEQLGLSMSSPTKVKVKYSEPASNADVSDIHGDIITSTAMSELISMEPYQPEKVNIPFSSETSSSSLDTLKQISGHIVVSNVQSASHTEHATIVTQLDSQNTQTFPPENVTVPLLSSEETVTRTGRTIVEKRIVKETFGEDKEKIFVTQRIQIFEGDSSEPISDDTASSIQRLRDTVRTEKIRFFEGAEPSKTIIMSSETLLRHADSSTDENDGQ